MLQSADLTQTLSDTALYVRYHYTTERLYCPRAVEATLERIDALVITPDPALTPEIVSALLAIRPLLPGELSPRLASLFVALDALTGAANDA